MQRYLYSLPWILFILIGCSGSAWAQLRIPATGTTTSSGSVAGMSPAVNFCNPANGKTDGLQMTVHPPLLYGAGYQRWVVEFSRVDGKPFDADRELRVRLFHGYDSTECSQVECNVVLPQGKLVGTADFIAPKWNNAYYWSIRVYQGNRELTGLYSSINYIARVNQNWGALDSSTDTLVVTQENGFDSPTYLEEHVGQLTNCWNFSSRLSRGSYCSRTGKECRRFSRTVTLHSKLTYRRTGWNWRALDRFGFPTKLCRL